MAGRQKLTRAFLRLAVLVGGHLLGAKLFDLLVSRALGALAHPHHSR